MKQHTEKLLLLLLNFAIIYHDHWSSNLTLSIL